MTKTFLSSAPGCSPGSPRPRRERGSVSVEFAFAFPILLLTAVAGIFVINILSVRQQLTVAANQSVRFCSDLPEVTAAGLGGYASCMRQIVRNQIREAGMNDRCDVNVNARQQDLGGGAQMLVGTVSCTYTGSGAGLVRTLIRMSSLFGGGGYTRDELTPVIQVETAFPL